MGVRMKVHWNDGTTIAEPGELVTFSAAFEARLVRSGLAEAESLNETRARAGMAALPELSELRRQYREAHGRNPSYNWDADELRRRIATATEETEGEG